MSLSYRQFRWAAPNSFDDITYRIRRWRCAVARWRPNESCPLSEPWRAPSSSFRHPVQLIVDAETVRIIQMNTSFIKLIIYLLNKERKRRVNGTCCMYYSQLYGPSSIDWVNYFHCRQSRFQITWLTILWILESKTYVEYEQACGNAWLRISFLYHIQVSKQVSK